MSRWSRFLAWLRNETPWHSHARWKEDQVTVVVDTVLSPGGLWVPYVDGAIGRLNNAIGRRFLVHAAKFPIDRYVQGFLATGSGYKGEILVRADGIGNDAGWEPVFAGPRRSRLWSAHIPLPETPPADPHRACVVVMHELGHALGLGHARRPDSFMWGRVWESSGFILLHEATMLYEAYGAGATT